MSFKLEKLGNYIDILPGFAFKSTDFVSDGVAVIKIKNICPPSVSLEDLTYVDNEIAEKSKKFILSYNDVLIAMTGSHINQWASVVGRVARIKYKNKTLLNQRVGKITIKQNAQADIDYVYYFLSQDSVKIQLASTAGGAANQANISPAHIKNLEFPCPDLETQERIGGILKAYDDLIENNKKQIKLLEEAAQRLYKEWFVDLRFPGHENVPVLDGVPEGWEKKKMKEVVVTTSGGTPSRGHAEYYRDGSFFWIKTKELDDGFIFETEEMITEEAVNKSSAKILKAGSIVLAMYGATIGKLGITTTEMTCNQACCVFDMSTFKNGTEFLFCWLLENRNFLVHQGKGSAQPNLSQEMIKNFEIILPDSQILEKFSSITSEFFSLKSSLQKKILLLKSKRDTILPKLMSGKIEV